MAQSGKPITSPVPEAWYPTIAFFMLTIGLLLSAAFFMGDWSTEFECFLAFFMRTIGVLLTAAFFIYEATSSKKNKSITKELITGAVTSIFLGFGSLFLLLATGVYV